MKRLILSLLALALFLPSMAQAYEDVPSDSPYFNGIDYLRRNGVFKETKLFWPQAKITRAEFVKYLVLLNGTGLPARSQVKLPFSDTQDNAWYAPYFSQAIRMGILSDREALAQPDKKLNTLDALTLLFHSQSIPIPKRMVGPVPYTDAALNKAAAPLVMRALALGLIQPEKDDYAGIYRQVTREKAAQMIYKMDSVNFSHLSPEAGSSVYDLEEPLQKIVSVWNLIGEDYIDAGERDQEKLSEAAIESMVNALGDPYSEYFNSQENKSLMGSLDGEVEGIGAFINQNDAGQVVIVSPIKGGPAEAAGLQPGDLLTSVDGKSAEGMALEEIVSLIKGPKGSEVLLGILRGGQALSLKVVRQVVQVPSMEYEMKADGKIMAIRIRQFSRNTAEQFAQVAELIQAKASIQGIVLDVRDNPGGLLGPTEEILGYLTPPQSPILEVKYADFGYTEYSQGRGELADYPMVVLVNENSASASEILAGALKDLELATVVGKTTFGKGTVQEVRYFEDESSLKLTIARWLTPSGHSIGGTGVLPDIEMEQGPAGSDAQMDRAIQLLLAK